MRVYFCTARPTAEIFERAIAAAGTREDFIFAADQILADHQGPRDIAAELTRTVVLIDACDAVISFPDWRTDKRCELEILHASAAGIPTYSADNYIDVDRETWRPDPVPAPGEAAPERRTPPARAEHGSRTARIFGEYTGPERKDNGVKGFVLLKCPACGSSKRYFLRERQTAFFCKCGEKIPLDYGAMVPAFANCSAPNCDQKQIKYMTNAKTNEETELQVGCLKCQRTIHLRPSNNGRAFVTFVPADPKEAAEHES